MIRYLLPLGLLMSLSITAFSATLLIKYSLHDCDLCNANLLNIAKVPGVEKIIVHSEISKGNSQVQHLNDYLATQGFSVIYNDSLYAAYDKSINSKLFILDEDNSIIFHSSLKDVTLAKIGTELKSLTKGGTSGKHIDLPSMAYTSYTKDRIYILDISGAKILVVNKDDLNVVADTLNIDQPSIIKDVYLNQFKSLEQYEGIMAAKRRHPTYPIKSYFYYLNASGDSVFIIAENQYIKPQGKDTFVKKFASILFFKGSKYVTSYPIASEKEICVDSVADCYTLNPIQFLRFNGNFFLQIRKKELKTYNFFLTRLTYSPGGIKLQPSEVLPFTLPIEHAQGALYNLVRLIHNKRYVALNLHSRLYDIESGEELAVPISMAANIITKENVAAKNINIKSEIFSFYLESESIRMLYRSNDSLKVAVMTLKSGTFRIEKEMLVTPTFAKMGVEFFSIDDKGYFFYSRKEQKFNYVLTTSD